MALEPEEVLVAGTGHVYRAPVGTAFPADAVVAPAAAWVELGYCTPEGARFNFGRDTTDIPAWQSLDPIRTVVTGTPREVSFDLLQWNGITLATALGGGVVDGEAGEWAYEPPDAGDLDTFALLVDGVDGDRTFRLGFRKVMVSSAIEFAFVRDNAAPLPITTKVLAAPGGAKPFILLTNDDAFTPA